MSAAVRVTLPTHLRTLAGLDTREASLEIEGPVTASAVLDALEAAHPVLRGCVREHGSLRRRDYVRLYAVGRDLSHDDVDAPLPAAVAAGDEPLLIVGAMAGG